MKTLNKTTMPLPKIITENEYPPIPDRNYDWVAYRENSDEDGPQGRGKTEQEAINDLIEQEKWQH